MLFAAAFALAARLAYEPTLATAERRVEVMGTTLDLVVRMKYRDEALAASEAALAEIRRVEALLTTWKPGGELWRVDEGAPGKPVAVSRRARGAAQDRLRVGAAHAGRLRPDRASPRSAPGTSAARAAFPRPPSSRPRARPRASSISAWKPPAVTRRTADAGIDEGAWARATGSSSPTACCGKRASPARSSISAARSSPSAATRTNGRGASRSPTRGTGRRPSPSSAS